MFHKWIGSDEDDIGTHVDCIQCGAHYVDVSDDITADIQTWDGSEPPLTCIRTQADDGLIVHGYEPTAHSLDNCKTFDDTGDCAHLAINYGCNCMICTG